MSISKNIKISGLIVCGLLGTIFVFYFLDQRDKTIPTTGKQDKSQLASEQGASTEYDYRDVDFAKKMIIIDQQAMQISNMGIQNASDIRIKELASNIYASSESDSQSYIALLKKWDETHLNLSDFPEMEGHDMYPTFPGMIKLAEIQQLRGLSGSEFDKAFLGLLIMHHEGVIELQTEKKNGVSPVKYADILKLQKENVKKQKEQLVQMRQLLK